MIKLFVTSRLIVESVKIFSPKVLVISITSPGQDDAKIEGENVFRFQFHDISRELFLEDRNMILNPMSRDDAERIADVAIAYRHYDLWVVHCEAGVSRSPGVALGLAKYIRFSETEEKLERQFPCHNRHVRRLIEEAMQQRVEKIMKEEG